MTPVVHRLEQRYSSQIGFVFLDTDDPGVAPLMREMAMIRRPHYYLLDADGTIVDQWVGVVVEGSFVRSIEGLLIGTPPP